MTDKAITSDRTHFLLSLRAVRQLRGDPVPQEVVDDVLEVARLSGSASNKQPWELVVVRDRETLQALAGVEGYAGHLAGAALGIVPVVAGEREEQEVYDEGRLCERIMLAAHALGVGSSIGWFVRGGRSEAKRLLGVPQGRTLRTAISLGYADESARRGRGGSGRKPRDAVGPAGRDGGTG